MVMKFGVCGNSTIQHKYKNCYFFIEVVVFTYLGLAVAPATWYNKTINEKGCVPMKYEERKEKILSLLDRYDTLSVQQLIDVVGSSPATIRRDITQMENEGVLQRYWGGVRRTQTPENLRKSHLQQQILDNNYTMIGKAAAEQLSDNELIFIGSGTTTLAMIPYIKNNNIHVITNGIPQMEALYRKNIQALLLCGFFKEYSRSVVGKETIEMLKAYRFDRAFLGANGIDEQLCMLSADEYEDSIKSLCIQQSKNTYLLAGKEKFHRTAYYTLPELLSKEVTIITNSQEYKSDKWKEVSGAYVGKVEELVKND